MYFIRFTDTSYKSIVQALQETSNLDQVKIHHKLASVEPIAKELIQTISPEKRVSDRQSQVALLASIYRTMRQI